MDKKILIPYFYTLKTRYKTKKTKMTYIFSNIIPVIIYIYVILEGQNILKILISGLIVIFSYISIYEVGYIFNDSYSIDNEEIPTLRLEKEEILYIKKNIKKIISHKILVSIGLITLLLLVYKNLNIINYLMLIMLTLIVYFVHNTFRSNKITYITFFLLSTLRFFSPLSIFLISNNQIPYLTSVVFSNSLIRNFEEIGHKKYYIGKINIYKVRHEFRVGYYFVLVILVTFFNIKIQGKIAIYYMFLYRFLLLIGVYLNRKRIRLGE